MAQKVGKKELSTLRTQAMRLQKRMKGASDKANKTITTVVHTTEVGAAAFIAGLVQGRTGGVEILGVPMDLGAAAALHVLAFAGIGGKVSEHLHGFGDGFLGAFLATTGRGVGQAWAAKDAKATPAATTGELPGHSAPALPPGAMLSEEERRLATMAASI